MGHNQKEGIKRAQKERADARHRKISEAIIQNNEPKIKRLCGTKEKAEKELQELEHFLNYGEN